MSHQATIYFVQLNLPFTVPAFSNHLAPTAEFSCKTVLYRNSPVLSDHLVMCQATGKVCTLRQLSAFYDQFISIFTRRAAIQCTSTTQEFLVRLGKEGVRASGAAAAQRGKGSALHGSSGSKGEKGRHFIVAAAVRVDAGVRA